MMAERTFGQRCLKVGSAGAVSTDRRNTLIFLERWSVIDEVSYTDVLHG